MRVVKYMAVLIAASLSLAACSPEVRTAKITRGPVVDAVYATGDVRAVRRAEISAEKPGRVTYVSVEVGDTVSEGKVVAALDAVVGGLSLTMAEQALASAQSARDEAQRNLDRMESLKSEEAVSEFEYDTAARRLERAEAEFKRLEAAFQAEEEGIARLEVKSPMPGVVIARLVEPGEYAMSGRRLITVIDPASLMVVVNVDESEFTEVAVGQEVAVAFDAFPGKKFAGTVELKSPKIDDITRTGMVRIAVKDADSLAEGMSATVNIVTRRAEDARLIPRDAVTIDKDKAWVWTIDSSGRLRRVEFTPGAMDETKVEIKEGKFEENAVLALDPSDEWREGMEVRRKN